MGVIIFLILSVVFGIMAINYQLNKITLLKAFKKGNTIVFGAKGKGKDLFTQKIIMWRKKKEYFSNISYGYKYNPISLKELDVKNTYHNLINEKIEITEKNYKFESSDIYISDAGNYLPSQYDASLHKTYPSFPIFYSLSRQLYNNNVHCNTQNLGRVWKALREQADAYIWCRGTIKLPFFLVVRFVYYDKYQSAENRLLPMKKSIGAKDKNLYNQWKATNGVIKKGYVIVRKKSIKYNTREFHKIFFGDIPYKEPKNQHGETKV